MVRLVRADVAFRPSSMGAGWRKVNGGEPESRDGMKTPNIKALLVAGFVVMAAVAAALGCPVFRNPANYAGAGGIVGYLRYVVAVHRRH